MFILLLSACFFAQKKFFVKNLRKGLTYCVSMCYIIATKGKQISRADRPERIAA